MPTDISLREPLRMTIERSKWKANYTCVSLVVAARIKIKWMTSPCALATHIDNKD